MATGKKSFVLYSDLIHTIEKMPSEKAGDLFKHILRYVNDLNPVVEDLIIELTFEPIKQQLKRDLEKWVKEIKPQRSESGRLGGIKSGEARRSKMKQNEANASITKQNEANEAVNVNVNVNDILYIKPKQPLHELQIFVNNNLLNVSKLKIQLSFKECENILMEHKIETIKELLMKMENYKELTKKYNSVNLTIRNWAKKELEFNPKPAQTDWRGLPI
jgi:hypothetical protein